MTNLSSFRVSLLLTATIVFIMCFYFSDRQLCKKGMRVLGATDDESYFTVCMYLRTNVVLFCNGHTCYISFPMVILYILFSFSHRGLKFGFWVGFLVDGVGALYINTCIEE